MHSPTHIDFLMYLSKLCNWNSGWQSFVLYVTYKMGIFCNLLFVILCGHVSIKMKPSLTWKEASTQEQVLSSWPSNKYGNQYYNYA
jgi:hypothetical protein